MAKKLTQASILCCFLVTSVFAQFPRGAQETSRSITGEVILEDGSHPERPVLVELVCYGEVRRQAQSHSGVFTIEFGRKRATETMDASVHTPGRDDEFFQSKRIVIEKPSNAFARNVQNNLDLSGCSLRARRRGHSSTSIRLFRRRPLDEPHVGTLILHRLYGTSTPTVDVKELELPRRAKQAYQRAAAELKKRKIHYSKTIRELEKAVAIAPNFAVAWQLLGEVRLTRKDEARARQAFKRTMEVDPNLTDPYISLARLAFKQARWSEMEHLSCTAMELDPSMIYPKYLCAAANYSLGKLVRAEELIQQIQKSPAASKYPMTHFLLGGILAQRGEIPSAATEFKRFLETQPEGALAQQSKQLLVDWKKQGLIKKALVSDFAEN